MRTHFKIIAIVAIVMGGIVMANHFGNCEGEDSAMYSSVDPELNISMDYPLGWAYRESRGSYNSYAQVQFLGPLDGEFVPSMDVTVESAAKDGDEPMTIEAKADDLVEKRMYFKEAQVLSRSEISILGVPAIDMTLSYMQMDTLHSMDAQEILCKERVVFFQKDNKFYRARYINSEKDFGAFEENFLKSVASLSIKE